MKKARRLLAVLLAVVMAFSAASVSVYGYYPRLGDPGTTSFDPRSDYHYPHADYDEKYYFTYEQGAAYLLDLLDDMLADMNFRMDLQQLDDDNNLQGALVDTIGGVSWGLGLKAKQRLRDGGASSTGDRYLDLTSVDHLITSLIGLSKVVNSDTAQDVNDYFHGLIGDILGDFGTKGVLHEAPLRPEIKRKRPRPGGGFDPTLRSDLGPKDDKEVLASILDWLKSELDKVLIPVVAGTFNFGDFIGPEIDKTPLVDLEAFLKNLIYVELIDDSFPEVKFRDGNVVGDVLPPDATLDAALQDLVNWALIDGTGNSAADGGYSVLGENFEPLLPGMRNYPGGACITAETITADRDCDGTAEACQMNFYQFVNNALRTLLSDMLGDLLREPLMDAFKIAVTPEYPKGDPSLFKEDNFNQISGMLISLMVEFGAPDPAADPDHPDPGNAGLAPLDRLDALLDWTVRDGGGLSVFLNLDYQGIHLTDNFIALLNNVARLAITLLPSLGLFEGSADLAYTNEELNAVKWYKVNPDADSPSYVLAGPDDDKASSYKGDTYLPFGRSDAVMYSTAVDANNNPTAFKYLADDADVNTTNRNDPNYVDIDLVSKNYVVSRDKVFACLVKMVMNDQIEECYFPEWADDMPSVLAYGLAGMAVSKLPEGNFYARLDKYHDETTDSTTPGAADPSLPYLINKTIGGATFPFPKAALDIIASFGAARLNGALRLSGNRFATDTSFERFLSELIIWAITTYVPFLSGIDRGNGNFSGGSWSSQFNALIGAVYSDFQNRAVRSDANWDAIYTFLDNTLLKLIPGWLPAQYNTSFKLLDGWLLGSILDVDLQKLIGIFSVNTGGELQSESVRTILFRLIDRVLALIFGDKPLLLPTNRPNVLAGNNLTSINSLDALLSIRINGSTKSPAASLPQFAGALIRGIADYNEGILGTILPLIITGTYERPYDVAYLGTNMTTHKVADLRDYMDSLKPRGGSIEGETFATQAEAEIAVDGAARVVKDGDLFKIKLSDESFYGTTSYDTKEAAKAVVERLKNAYVKEKVSGDTTEYVVMYRMTYLDAATANPITLAGGALPNDGQVFDKVGNVIAEDRYKAYSDFAYSRFIDRGESTNPMVGYGDGYKFFEFEDFPYYESDVSHDHFTFPYENVKEAVDKAEEFIVTYEEFSNNQLPDAYGDWLKFSIETRMKDAGIYDGDGDGEALADEYPHIPQSFYPFFTTTDTTSFEYMDAQTGTPASFVMKDAVGTEFEQLQQAIALGNDPANNVELSDRVKENLVRLALGAMTFDITEPLRPGSEQWEHLSQAQQGSITTLCDQYGCVYDAATNSIKRKAFAVIDSGFNGKLGSGIETKPLLDVDSLVKKEDKTFSDEVKIAIHDCYAQYVYALVSGRRGLYNMIDLLSYRYHQAELRRNRANSAIDNENPIPTPEAPPDYIYQGLKTLRWALQRFEADYIDSGDFPAHTGRRNLRFVQPDAAAAADFSAQASTPYAQNVYTKASYEKFRDAYDFANSLVNYIDENQKASDITQSMISEALYGVLRTYKDLVPFDPARLADFEQLRAFHDIAANLLDPANQTTHDENYGATADSLENLGVVDGEALNNYINHYNDYTFEDQTDIDAMANSLMLAILALQFKSNPRMIPTDPIGILQGVQVSMIAYTPPTQPNQSSYIVGHVTGLVEGIGLTDELLETIGMPLDPTYGQAGGTVRFKKAGGTNENPLRGTGCSYEGRLGGRLRFNYFAVLYGDLNGDTYIGGADAARLQHYLAQGAVNTQSHFVQEAADADHSGAADASDANRIKNHYRLEDASVIVQGATSLQEITTTTAPAA